MHPFNVTHLLTYCLLTYYFSFWFPLNILWKTTFMQRSLVLKAPCTLDRRHCTIFRLGNTSFTGSDLWPMSSRDLTLVYCKIWHVIQQRVCHHSTLWAKWYGSVWSAANNCDFDVHILYTKKSSLFPWLHAFPLFVLITCSLSFYSLPFPLHVAGT